MKRLGELAEFLSGFPQIAKSTLESDLSGDLSRYVSAVGLRALTSDGSINWESLDQVRPPQQLRSDHRLAEGDVVISARGSGIKIGILHSIPSKPVYSTTNVIVVRPNPTFINPTYLWASLTKHRGDPREEFFSRGTTLQWSITLRELSRLPIELPPMAEQRRFADAVLSLQSAADSARNLAAQYDRTLQVFIAQSIGTKKTS
jgi:restriction endonuclease S subunit